MKLVPVLWVLLLGSLGVLAPAKIPNAQERIALNFMRPDALYGRATEGRKVGQVDLRGIIAGDRKWRKSAEVLSNATRI